MNFQKTNVDYQLFCFSQKSHRLVTYGFDIVAVLLWRYGWRTGRTESPSSRLSVSQYTPLKK